MDRESSPVSGAAMALVGVWLVAQALGGNLAGRLRAAAGPAVGTFGAGSVTGLSGTPEGNETLVLIQQLMKRDGLSASEATERVRSGGR